MGTQRLYIVDVFAEAKYAGNQLAVIAAAGGLSDSEMQKVARETNFSETTFIVSAATAAGTRVRIFTPIAEIPFAGHPTLGTAWVIRHELLRQPHDVIALDLPIGQVPVHFVAEPDGRELLWMHPKPPELGAVHSPEAVAAVLSLGVDDIDPRAPIQTATAGIAFTIVPLRTLSAVKRARYDAGVTERLGKTDFPLALLLFAPEAYDRANQLNARMFAAAFGVPEDPATGSANACLGAYLSQHRYFGSTTVDVRVEQGYEIRRPSLLRVRASAGTDGTTVQVGGRVVLTARGELV